MFQFSGFRHIYLCIQYMLLGFYSQWVPPFGYLWINTYLRFPTAFRSLSRPSSPPDAKAFPMRSLKLNLFAVLIMWSSIQFCLSFLDYSLLLQFTLIFRTWLSLSFLDLALFSFQGALFVILVFGVPGNLWFLGLRKSKGAYVCFRHRRKLK